MIRRLPRALRAALAVAALLGLSGCERHRVAASWHFAYPEMRPAEAIPEYSAGAAPLRPYSDGSEALPELKIVLQNQRARPEEIWGVWLHRPAKRFGDAGLFDLPENRSRGRSALLAQGALLTLHAAGTDCAGSSALPILVYVRFTRTGKPHPIRFGNRMPYGLPPAWSGPCAEIPANPPRP